MFIFCSHRRMNLLLFLQVFFPGAADDDRAKLEDDDDKGVEHSIRLVK